LKRLLVLVVLLSLTCCVEQNKSENSPNIIIDGSSTVFLITERIVKNYRQLNPESKIQLDVSGTGGGFQKFCMGLTDVADASRRINKKERELCQDNGVLFFAIPIALDGIAVVVNNENDWVDYLRVSELKMIWDPTAERDVTRWNQVRDNWPNREIKLFGPGTNSGTYDYFVSTIIGESHSSRGDYVASEEDDVLVKGVASDKYALGIFGLGYYQESFYDLRLIPIDDEEKDNGEGPVIPSYETVKTGNYQPLSRQLFLYVSKASLKKVSVKKFIDFYLENAAQVVSQSGYVPQPAEIYQRNRNAIDSIITAER